MKALMTGAVAAVLLASTAVQAQMKPEEMVETRQAGYQFMSWNMGKIKAQVVDGKEPYDQARGMNSTGETWPRVGCCQRNKASAWHTWPCLRSSLGW